jgi:hypothetical protein
MKALLQRRRCFRTRVHLRTLIDRHRADWNYAAFATPTHARSGYITLAEGAVDHGRRLRNCRRQRGRFLPRRHRIGPIGDPLHHRPPVVQEIAPQVRGEHLRVR